MVGSPPCGVNAALSPVAISPLAHRSNRLIRLAPPLRAKDRDAIKPLHAAQGDAQTKPRRSGVCLIAINVGLSGAQFSATCDESHQTKSDKQHGVAFGFRDGGGGLQRQ